MTPFDENIIERGNPQVARKTEEESAAMQRAININVAFGSKVKKDDTPDEVAKQHSLYTADRWNGRRYFSDFQQKTEVMRANDTRISTRLDDRQTVGIMLDLAQSRGWDTVRLRGTQDFKREAWVQAKVRGLSTEGYSPKSTDLQEAERRTAARTAIDGATKRAPTVKAAPQQTGEQKQEVQAAVRRQRPDAWGEVEKVGRQIRAAQKTGQVQSEAAKVRSKETA